VTIPRETWTELQRAETLLFRAAVVRHPKAVRGLFDGFEVEGAARNLLIRAGSGFPANALRPEDYLGRYPFSSVGAIRAVFEELVESGGATEVADDAFALTERGVRLVGTWMNRVAPMMTDPDPGDVSPADVEALIAFDRQIVESLRAGEGAHSLAACDADELEVDRNLLARWPAWDEQEIERLRGIVGRLNRRLLELIQPERGGTDE
jgi:hypothetical protein